MIIKTEKDFKCLLNELNEPQANAIFEAMREHLPDIIKILNV